MKKNYQSFDQLANMFCSLPYMRRTSRLRERQTGSMKLCRQVNNFLENSANGSLFYFGFNHNWVAPFKKMTPTGITWKEFVAYSNHTLVSTVLLFALYSCYTLYVPVTLGRQGH